MTDEKCTGQKVFLTADLHLFHKNIIKYENRPFNNLDDMHLNIVKNWNNTVGQDDRVFILGDLSFGSKFATREIVEQLHGTKVLIKGNHDCHANSWYIDTGIAEVSKYPILYNNYYILSHEPMLYLKEPFLNCHGHVHSSPNFNTFTKASACLCVERWHYTPVSFFAVTKAFLRFQHQLDMAQALGDSLSL